MPDVPPPDDCPRFGGPRDDFTEIPREGHHRISEYREAPLAGAAENPGSVALWARLDDEKATTSAKLAFLGDMVPIAVCRAAGVAGAGTSLDNSFRIARLVDSEWLLIHLQAHAAADGYGYGVSHFWTPDGELLGTSSQTAKLFSIDSFVAKLAARSEAPS
jgi:acyl-CoA thioesterase